MDNLIANYTGNIIALALFFLTLALLRWYLVVLGRLSFWKLANLHFSEFFNHMDNDATWVYSSDSISKPSDQYVGPFYFVRNGQTNTIFALAKNIEKSQQNFISQFSHLSTHKPFPIISALTLIYPILAIFSVHTSGILFPLGYGFSNLGYLLVAAGIFGGSFRALGLDFRLQVLSSALIFWIMGALIINFF
tara:strand:+ start:652 stop:1227 length:576 start_codon:yes stop_codon:yes gene_type:complete